jgi:hypothetical protein
MKSESRWFHYTDVVHFLVFAVLEDGRHQKYPVAFRSAVNSVVDQINCQLTTLPLHKRHRYRLGICTVVGYSDKMGEL